LGLDYSSAENKTKPRVSARLDQLGFCQKLRANS
jgi:hypothetical protein